jgi:hypothetical protein
MQAISAGRTLSQIEAEIRAHSQYVTASIIAIGNALTEAKAQLAHGEWEAWLNERVNFSQRTANNFMRIAREIGPGSALAALPYAKALALLDVPAEKREQAASELDADNRSAAALRKAIADRRKAEEAKAAAEAERDRAQKAAAEAERARDYANTLSEQYSDRLCDTQAELEALKSSPMPTVTATVAPDDYEECKAKAAQADALKRRAEEAEQYAEQQEAAAKAAQAAARRLETERLNQREAAADDPYSEERLAEAVRAFLAAMGALPHMGAYLFTLPGKRLAAYRPSIEMIRVWADGAEAAVRRAEADKTGAIESGED